MIRLIISVATIIVVASPPALASVVRYHYEGNPLEFRPEQSVSFSGSEEDAYDTLEWFVGGCSYTGDMHIDETKLGRSLASTSVEFYVPAKDFLDQPAVIEPLVVFDVLPEVFFYPTAQSFIRFDTDEDKNITSWHLSVQDGPPDYDSFNREEGIQGDGFYGAGAHFGTDGPGEWTIIPAPIPVPAAFPLLGGALVGLSLLRRRKAKQ